VAAGEVKANVSDPHERKRFLCKLARRQMWWVIARGKSKHFNLSFFFYKIPIA
jgi:hypothetical protein